MNAPCLTQVPYLADASAEQVAVHVRQAWQILLEP